MSDPNSVSDLEINNNIRRIMTKRRIDVNKISYRTSTGTVSIGGELCFVGKKLKPEELVHEIEALESFIVGVKGVKDCKIDFDGYEKSDEGDWLYKGAEGAPQKKVVQKSEEDLLKEKIKARVLESLENMQYSPGTEATAGTTAPGADPSAATQAAAPARTGLHSAPKEAVEEFLASIKALVIKCGDCGTEVNFCPKCGDKIKITFVTDEEEWNYDGKTVSGGAKTVKSAVASTPAIAATSAPRTSLHDLIAEDDEASGLSVAKQRQEEEAAKKPEELSLAERAKMMLQKSKEDGIKKKGWMQKSSPKVDMDDDYDF